MMVICAFIQENYGKADKDCVAKVKELYKALNLEVLFPAFIFNPNISHNFIGCLHRVNYNTLPFGFRTSDRYCVLFSDLRLINPKA